MTPFLSDFEFLRPVFLWLFIPLFILFFILKKRTSSFSTWERVCDAPLLKYLLTDGIKTPQKMRLLWLFFTFFFAVIALSGPSFYKIRRPAAVIQNPLMIVLNLEDEMNRSDIRPSRLSRAKIEITDILQKSQASPSGLIVYTGEPFLISPLAEDFQIITNLLSAVQTDIMPLSGNRLDRAVDLAVSRLSQNGFSSGNILIFTSTPQKETEKTIRSVQNAAQKGYHVNIFDISLSPHPEFQALATKGNGKYTGTFDFENTKISDFISSFRSNDFETSQKEIVTPQDNGWFFVFLSAFCFLYLFRKGTLLILLLTLFPQITEAGFLFNADQEGAHAFSIKEYNTAAEKFENTDWKAAAFYKAENYESALKYLADKTDERSLYNKGNALAKSGDIENAIKTYETVLEMNPKNEDARFNLEYLKQQQQNNQSSSSNTENEKDNDKKQQKKQDQNQDQNEDKNQEQEQNQSQDQENEEQQQSQDQNQTQGQDKKQNEDENQENSSQDDNQQTKEQNEMTKQNESEKQESHSQNQKNDEQNKPEKEDIPQNVKEEMKQENKDDKYNETVQARTQRFREIKEDTGGLLKALIKEEYLKKRY